ncbi:hypothetical protein GQ54DRAFT_58152 [Martensiomyces pterosporus]|nr:hypothetical protein GQ54DRAFT_58152 [Martensiomyces pterosporus]
MPPTQATTVPPEEREDYFSLTFKTLRAPVRKFTLHTSSIRTVAQVKRHLSRVSNIPFASMRLVLGGKGLVDSKLIGDYPVNSASVIQIISKPAGAAASPVPEEDKGGPVDAAAAENNPLSSVLDQESGGQQAEVPAAAAGEAVRTATQDHDYTTDASSDAGADAVNSPTKDQLQQQNSAFRVGLRELIHSHFGSTQASAVDNLLESYFSTL